MSRTILKSIVLAALVLVCASAVPACAEASGRSQTDSPQQQSLLPAFESGGTDDVAYRIGPGNLIQIKIFGEAGVNQVYRVDESGFITHALVGRVKLGGFSVSEAEKVMETKLAGDYLVNPQVNVFIMEHSHYSVLGEVNKPGAYEITGRVTLLQAISMAGGFGPIANQRGVKILRKGSAGNDENAIVVDTTRITQRDDRSADIDIEADDVIVVPKSFF